MENQKNKGCRKFLFIGGHPGKREILCGDILDELGKGRITKFCEECNAKNNGK